MNRHFHYMLILILLAALAARTNIVDAHGTPIHVEKSDEHVEESDEHLIVSLGLSDPLGYSPMIFHENDDDGEPFATTNLNDFGRATIWQLPGYDIFGLEENSGLFLEPIARPVAGTDPVESRVLWYWNPETALVEPADPAIRLQVRKTETLHTTLLASSGTAPPPLQLAAPVAADMNFHNHLVLYALDVAAPDGAYGFFARLTSNLYHPSDPFLLMFNLNVFDYEQMTEAALAINQAALLPGDFNRDDHVDAADYTVWRNSSLGPEKYAEWKSHFGQSFTGGGADSMASVPEPASLVLTASLLAWGACVFVRLSRPEPICRPLPVLKIVEHLHCATTIMLSEESAMKFGFHLFSCLAVCLSAALAHAQGGVMGVNVSNGTLVVSNGVADNAGFADRMFVEDDADGYAQSVSVSGFGPAFRWTVPGVRISGMNVNSGLYIEAVARPDNTSNPSRDRVLWYWSGITNSLQDAPIDNHFLIYKTFAGQGIYLESTYTEAPPQLKIASPLPTDLDIDDYGNFVKFALHKESPPPIGVYGIFARFKSDEYAPSDPFLLVFNHGQLSPSRLMTGALAINAAAADEAAVPNGDFNGDGIVDAADYTRWRNGLGTQYTLGDYDLWKRDFGLTFDSPGGGAVASVPEPALLAPLAALSLLNWRIPRRGRRHFVACRGASD